jgi:plastocyanin
LASRADAAPGSRRRVVAAALAVASLAATAFAIAADRAAATHEIVMQAVQFAPATLKVKRGDVVVWSNRDPFPHTATAAGVFDSESIAEGKSWRWRADRTGTIAYVCTFHPTMKGTLEVE